MDIEKTMQFIVEHQAQFEANLAALNVTLVELRDRQDGTERLINAFAKSGQAQIELHSARLDGLESRLEVQERDFSGSLRRLSAEGRERPRRLRRRAGY